MYHHSVSTVGLAGEERIVSGKVALIGQRVQITHPDKVLKPAAIDELSLFEAVYELTQGLTADL